MPAKKEAFKPRKEDKEEIQRRVDINTCAYSIWLLQGMMNTTKHIIRKVVSSKDAQWFEDCIGYMMQQVRKSKVKLQNKSKK